MNARTDPEVGALVQWALHAVDALHYLADVDERVFADPSRPALAHRLQVVDLGHTTWGCITAITALDWCAAAAWHMAVPGRRKNEKDVRSFDPQARRKDEVEKNRTTLDPDSLGWIDGVLSDDAYRSVRYARNPPGSHRNASW